MDRLNAVPGGTITSTCAGHPERGSAPEFAFRTASGRAGSIELEIANTGTNQDALHLWWEHAIVRLETDMGCDRG